VTATQQASTAASSVEDAAVADAPVGLPQPAVATTVEAKIAQVIDTGEKQVAPAVMTGLEMWEVHTVKKGWAPLAPTLQEALSCAMEDDTVERVEVFIDVAARSWIQDPSTVDDTARARCVVYAVFPRESKMAKVGGELPRPIRRRPLEPPVEPPPPRPTRTASQPATVAPTTLKQLAEPQRPKEQEGLMDTEQRDDCDDEEDEDADNDIDPLMFTAAPTATGGVVLSKQVFEKLRQGASERCAGYRYGDH